LGSRGEELRAGKIALGRSDDDKIRVSGGGEADKFSERGRHLERQKGGDNPLATGDT